MDGLSILQRLGGGRVIEDLGEALIVTAEEVVRTGKAGTVTLALKVSTKSAGDVMVMIEEQIARSAPKKDPKGAYFFAVGGDLHRSDPRQTTLDFRTVDRATGEIRDSDAGHDLREVSS